MLTRSTIFCVVGASLHSRLGSGHSSLLACAGEKLPEIEVWGAVGEREYVWAEVENRIGCRKYQADLYNVLTSTSNLHKVPSFVCMRNCDIRNAHITEEIELNKQNSKLRTYIKLCTSSHFLVLNL